MRGLRGIVSPVFVYMGWGEGIKWQEIAGEGIKF